MMAFVVRPRRRLGTWNTAAMARTWLSFLAIVLLALSPLPARAQGVSGGPCADIVNQIAAVNQDLDQQQQNAQPQLTQASQAAVLVLGELTVAALQGAPGLTPDLASSAGATTGQVGADIMAWLNSGASIRDLPDHLNSWEASLASLSQLASLSPDLLTLQIALTQLDQVAAAVVADGAELDGLNAELQDCQRGTPPPASPTPNPAPPTAGNSSNCTATKNAGGGAADVSISAPCLAALQGNAVVEVAAHPPEVATALLAMATQHAGTQPISCDQLSVGPPVPFYANLPQAPRGITSLAGFVGYVGCLYRAVPSDGFPADGVFVAWFNSPSQAEQAYKTAAAALP